MNFFWTHLPSNEIALEKVKFSKKFLAQLVKAENLGIGDTKNKSVLDTEKNATDFDVDRHNYPNGFLLLILKKKKTKTVIHSFKSFFVTL